MGSDKYAPPKLSGGYKKNKTSPALRFSAPLVVGLCVGTFLLGSFFGGRPIKFPEVRKPPRRVSVERGQLERSLLDKATATQNNAAADVSMGVSGSLHADVIRKGDVSSQEGQGGKVEAQIQLPATQGYGNTGDDYVTNVNMQRLSWQPRAYFFPGFADKERCDNIVRLARGRLVPSGLALREGEKPEDNLDVRTSSGTFLSSGEDHTGALKWVAEKMHRVAMVPPEHGEAFNVLRYELGQKYNSHMDAFDPKEYGPQNSQRIASFLLYLSEWEEGGETNFPYEGYKNMDIGYNYRDCIGLKVKPRQGDALLFWSTFHNGTIDKAALHGSCPVVKGEKWVATRWIRDRPGGYFG